VVVRAACAKRLLLGDDYWGSCVGAWAFAPPTKSCKIGIRIAISGTEDVAKLRRDSDDPLRRPIFVSVDSK
jgi:hypothetical protein